MRTKRCDGSFGSCDMQMNTVKSEQSVRISLNEIQTSYLHEAIKDLTPTDLEISELNLSVQLPSDPEMSNDILNRFRNIQNRLILTNRSQKALPIIENYTPKHIETGLDELTNELLHTGGYMRSFLIRDKAQLMSNTILDNFERINKEMAVSKAAVSKACQKLAVLAVEHIKEQSISKETLSRCQISDDYLNSIYESVRDRNKNFPRFI